MRKSTALLLAACVLIPFAQAQNTLAGNLTVQQAVKLTGAASPAQITSNVNDYAPAGFATAAVLRLQSDASRTITGLAGGTAGRMVWLTNVGAQTISLPAESLASSAANRFAFGASGFDLIPGGSLSIWYDATASRWRAATNLAAGGGGGTIDQVARDAAAAAQTTADAAETPTGAQAKADAAQAFAVERTNHTGTQAAATVTEDVTHRFTTDTEKATWNALVSFPGFGATGTTAAAGNDVRLSDARTPLAHDQAWSTITSTPSTLSGYGITDAQPVDSDLTSIAALVTDAFGRDLLTTTTAANVRTYIGAGTSSFDGTYSSLSGIPQDLSITGIPQFAKLGIRTGSPGTTLEVDDGSGALVSPITPTGIRLASADSVSNSMEAVAFSAQAFSFKGRVASGTRAAPSATSDGRIFLNFGAFGYDGTAWTTAANAQIQFVSDGGWSGSSRGTWIAFRGTPSGSTALENWATLYRGNFGIGISAPTSQLHTSGTVRFAGLPSGILATDAAGVLANRTVTGTADQVTVTNGDGVSGNPTLALPQSISTTSTPRFARVGIGAGSLATAGIYLTSADTGGTSVYSIYAAPNIKSDVTTRYSSITTAPSTQAASFNLATLYHFYCTQGAIGEGSTVGEQSGFVVSSGLTGATNNYGFRSAIPAATGRWNTYMDGTAANYFAGVLSIGTVSSGRKLTVSGNGIHVVGTTGTTGALTAEGTTVSLQADSAAATRFLIDAGGANAAGYVSLNGGATSGYVQLATGGVERVRVATAGGVRFNAYGAGTLVTDSSGNITASSDRRIKNVSGKFTRGLEDVIKIQPRFYTWKPESGMNTEDLNVGFIAQDVQDAIPEAVGTMKTNDVEEDDGSGKKVRKSKREASGYLTLSDRPIIAALVNAVKELKAANDDLRARVAALEAKP